MDTLYQRIVITDKILGFNLVEMKFQANSILIGILIILNK